jgi:hypothetical protein
MSYYEAGGADFAADSQKVHAQAAGGSPARRSALVDLCSQREGEHGSRRLVHFNITQHPTAAWTLQQLREVIGSVDGYRYLLHDRDSIFAQHLDASISRLGLRVLKSPPRNRRD